MNGGIVGKKKDKLDCRNIEEKIVKGGGKRIDKEDLKDRLVRKVEGLDNDINMDRVVWKVMKR